MRNFALVSLIAGVASSLAAGRASAAPASNTPCMAVRQACQQAGFHKGGESTGKGLFKNCLTPIYAGKSVPGVVVNPADVAACRPQTQA